MTDILNLDAIRQKSEEDFSSLPIQLSEDLVVNLLNPLMLDEDKRAALTKESDEDEDGEKETTLESFQRQIRTIADTPEGAEALIDALGKRVADYASLIRLYNKHCQAGEA